VLTSHCKRSWAESQAVTSENEILKKKTKKRAVNKIKKNKRIEPRIVFITKKITTTTNKTPKIPDKLIIILVKQRIFNNF